MALGDLIGVDHVLFGSDYPHPEGLADPASYVAQLAGVHPATASRALTSLRAKLKEDRCISTSV